VSEISTNRARWEVIAAAILWSLSSFFTRLFSEPTFLGTHEPKLDPLHIAIYRALFAGITMAFLVRPAQMRFKPMMIVMIICFTTMNGLFLTAMSLGSAANAILLQNTAPVWVCLLAWFFLRETTDRRTLLCVFIAMIGGTIIVSGNWSNAIDGSTNSQASILLMATGSGVMYACVILFLRHFRSESAPWLTLLNLMGTAICTALVLFLLKGPNEFWRWICIPTKSQLCLLAVFGSMQLAVAYCLFSRGLRAIGAQEAGIITLIEPLLNAVWAYLISPERDTPTRWTVIGGGILLFAMLMRYLRFTKPSQANSRS
jgi:drug/metabolite transporter, DME family